VLGAVADLFRRGRSNLIEHRQQQVRHRRVVRIVDVLTAADPAQYSKGPAIEWLDANQDWKIG